MCRGSATTRNLCRVSPLSDTSLVGLCNEGCRPLADPLRDGHDETLVAPGLLRWSFVFRNWCAWLAVKGESRKWLWRCG